MKINYYKSVYGISCVKLLKLKLMGLVSEVKKIKNKMKNSKLKNLEYVNNYNVVIKTTNKQIYQNQLYFLREEIRSYHLAIGFLQNKPYQKFEINSNTYPDHFLITKILLENSYYTVSADVWIKQINSDLLKWLNIEG